MKIDLSRIFEDYKLNEEEKCELVSKFEDYLSDYLQDNFELKD